MKYLTALSLVFILACGNEPPPANPVKTPVEFAWTAPLDYTDGSPIIDGIAYFEITCNDMFFAFVEPRYRSITFELLPGSYTCHMRANTETQKGLYSTKYTIIIENSLAELPDY